MKTLIIAEIGINHNREMSTAVALIDAAKDIGANVAKFQLEVGGDYCPTFEQMKHLYLYCRAIGMKFACTAFDIPSINYLLKNTEMEFVKIASCDTQNMPLLEAAYASGLPIIQSIKEGELITIPRHSHKANARYLHVVSEYPTPPGHANLRRATEKWCSGLSDHSGKPFMPIAAVALGAKVIECHLTLDRKLTGPDHTSSLEPVDFAWMVRAIREVEQGI